MKVIRFPAKRVEASHKTLTMRLTSIKHRLRRGEITEKQAVLMGLDELAQAHKSLVKLGHEATGFTAEVGDRQMDALKKAREAWMGIVKDSKK